MRNRTLCSFIGVFVASVLLVGCSTAEKDLERSREFDAHERIGLGFLSAQNYPSALVEFQKARAIQPDSAAIHNDLALVYFFRDHPDLAEKELKRALKINPSYTDARNNLGRLYLELAQYPEGIHELLTCEQDLTYSAPEKVQANLAFGYFHSGEYAEAKGHAQRALKRTPKMCEALVILAESDFEMSDYATALGELQTAQNECAGSIRDELSYYIGLSYYHSGDLEKSKTILQELAQGQSQSENQNQNRAQDPAHQAPDLNHDQTHGRFQKRAQAALRIIR